MNYQKIIPSKFRKELLYSLELSKFFLKVITLFPLLIQKESPKIFTRFKKDGLLQGSRSRSTPISNRSP